MTSFVCFCMNDGRVVNHFCFQKVELTQSPDNELVQENAKSQPKLAQNETNWVAKVALNPWWSLDQKPKEQKQGLVLTNHWNETCHVKWFNSCHIVILLEVGCFHWITSDSSSALTVSVFDFAWMIEWCLTIFVVSKKLNWHDERGHEIQAQIKLQKWLYTLDGQPNVLCFASFLWNCMLTKKKKLKEKPHVCEAISWLNKKWSLSPKKSNTNITNLLFWPIAKMAPATVSVF